MNDYIEVRVDCSPCSETITDVVAAFLADAGFESFLPDEKGLLAYIPQKLYSENIMDCLSELPFECAIRWSSAFVEGKDWNSEWEQNYFQPIVVEDKCVIHSTFHTDYPKCEYDIVIDPKMAFGTGHHATTYLMVSRLLSASLSGKKVVDMGTGTGILAMLSAMSGAEKVVGIEIDEAAYVNALENRELNHIGNLQLIHGDATVLSTLTDNADVFLANINRNVIINDFDAYASVQGVGGLMFLSGFYESDVPMILERAALSGYHIVDTIVRQDWACVALVRKNI
ncbi:MAG: 50S ribosomal protein L11 methyltransferase [Paramuribaculum sp.]|nr:50S ribosomal protein L11 methyltransferase [Paramuribaculum sp.]